MPIATNALVNTPSATHAESRTNTTCGGSGEIGVESSSPASSMSDSSIPSMIRSAATVPAACANVTGLRSASIHGRTSSPMRSGA